MIKLLLDSTIEIWGTKYINDPKIREQEDRDKEIHQIEAIPGNSNDFIVEVFRPAMGGVENEHTY